MVLQDQLHFGPEFLTKPAPIAIIFGVNEQRCDQIDVLNVQPAAWSDQQICSTVYKWKLRFSGTAIVPPSEISVKIPLCVIKYKANSSWMVEARFERCSEVSLRVPTQRVGAEIECNPQQGGRSRAEPPRRTELKLDLPVGKYRRANVLLDTLNKMYRRSCASDRRQYEAQRGTRVLEIVDLQNPRCAPKALNQVFELFTIVQTMNFEANRQQAVFVAPKICRERCGCDWSFRLQEREQVLESVRVAHRAPSRFLLNVNAPMLGIVHRTWSANGGIARA